MQRTAQHCLSEICKVLAEKDVIWLGACIGLNLYIPFPTEKCVQALHSPAQMMHCSYIPKQIDSIDHNGVPTFSFSHRDAIRSSEV